MKSVQEIKRKISKVRITLADGVWGWDRRKELYKLAIPEIFKILKQFSATIKHFRLKNLQSSRIKIPDFLKMLSLVPNTKHLQACFCLPCGNIFTHEFVFAKLNALPETLLLFKFSNYQRNKRNVFYVLVANSLQGFTFSASYSVIPSSVCELLGVVAH